MPADHSIIASLALGASHDDVIDFAGDTDLYRVELVAGQSYAFDMLGTASGLTLDDPLLELLDGTMNPIAVDDDSGVLLNARIDHAAIATGTYYLRAGAYDGAGSYRVRMSDTSGRIDDHGNDATRAGVLAIGGAQAGAVDFAGDRDWFRVDLRAGATYAFTLANAGADSLADPHLALRDAAGRTIAQNDDANPYTLDSRIDFTATTGGVYYLDAGAFSDTTGRYVIAAGPAQDMPVASPPSVEAPVAETPVIRQPTVEAPVAQSPAAETPVAQPSPSVTPTAPAQKVQAGTPGDDIFQARPGDDLIAGGAGNDVAVYAGMAHRYARTMAGGSGTIAGGPEGGTDTLQSIETIRFADGYVTSDPSSHAAQVHRLYALVLERSPDSLGLNDWTHTLDRGGSLVTVANGFAGSVEFQTKTAGLTTDDFVEFLYNNALGRASDAMGKTNWVTSIENGVRSRGEVIAGFSESDEYRMLTDGQLDDGLFIHDETYAAIASLYDAFADRLPDEGGLIHWVNIARHGSYTMEQIADGFANSPEFRARIDGLDERGIVEHLYRNVLDREGDAPGIENWTRKLEADHDIGSLLWEFARSTEHRVLMQPHLADGVAVL